jgi:hypothetical protein
VLVGRAELSLDQEDLDVLLLLLRGKDVPIVERRRGGEQREGGGETSAVVCGAEQDALRVCVGDEGDDVMMKRTMITGVVPAVTR